MSFFPRITHESPFFGALEDFHPPHDRPSRRQGRGATPAATPSRGFQPSFDVKELADGFELEGDFPGVPRKDINIEWSDSNTLVVSGHTDHRSQRPVEEDSADKSSKKATVEDDGDSKAVAPLADSKKDSAPKPKFWVTERSVGEFYRSFSFPSRVNHDGVKASLKDGVLTIFVPKASRPKAKKIEIDA